MAKLGARAHRSERLAQGGQPHRGADPATAGCALCGGCKPRSRRQKQEARPQGTAKSPTWPVEKTQRPGRRHAPHVAQRPQLSALGVAGDHDGRAGARPVDGVHKRVLCRPSRG